MAAQKTIRIMAHPAYNPYHEFVNECGGQRCDICFGLKDDQYHATNAQSAATAASYPVQSPDTQGQAPEADPEIPPAAFLPKGVPGSH